VTEQPVQKSPVESHIVTGVTLRTHPPGTGWRCGEH